MKVHERWAQIPEGAEISGFGGGYENACRALADEGVRWLHENRHRTRANGAGFLWGRER